MFTGLIEHVGQVSAIASNEEGGARLSIDLGPLAEDAKLGDSIAVNGCCLTIVTLEGAVAAFDAVPETLKRTTTGHLAAGAAVNLERALTPGARLGGHFVQGHIDGTATVKKTFTGGRWAEWHLVLDDPALAPYVVEKGSIALDGISLTVAGEDGAGGFWVALIPETLARTVIASRKEGARMNVETDILGKYVYANLAKRGLVPPPGDPASGGPPKSKVDEAWLKEQGY